MQEYESLDPLQIDRGVAACALAWQRWSQRVAEAPTVADDPFQTARHLLGRRRLLELGDWPEAEPLRVPLRRWILRLAEQRINHASLVQVAFERYGREHAGHSPEAFNASLGELVRRAVVDAPRRADWLTNVQSLGGDLTSSVALLWQRRREVTVRMGLGLDEWESPCADLPEVAERWLAATRDVAEEYRCESVATLLASASAEQASVGWPSQLSLRSLAEWFRDTDLLRDVQLAVPRFVEQPIGGSSFLRALEAFGSGWALALAPKDQPFCIAHDPYGLHTATLGALYASLLFNGEFVRRRLNLSRNQVEAHRRAIACTLLLELRGRALKVRLRSAAYSSADAFREQFVEQTERVFGVRVAASTAGVLWRLEVTDLQAFAAALAAAVRVDHLVNQHDEDWFRNPRATEQLRHETMRPPNPAVEAETLSAGLELWQRWLSEALR